MVILHGLFGSSDNWQTLGKRFAEHFEVHLIDQRNHGRSDHSDEMNYDLMVADLEEYFEEHFLRKVILLGHSMGGKTAIRFAQLHPYYLQKVIVGDIGPQPYEHTHDEVLKGLNSIDLATVKSRGEAERLMSEYIPDKGTRQFLLKNLYWVEKGQLGWRMNLPVLAASMDQITADLSDLDVDLPTLFIRGSLSHYIKDEDIPIIAKQFPNSEVVTMDGVGHWIHAERPDEFYDIIMKFASS